MTPRADHDAHEDLCRRLVTDRAIAERFLDEWRRPYFGPDSSDAVAAVLRALRAALATAAPTACTERLGSLPCTGEHHPTHTFVGTSVDDRGTRNAEGTP